MQSDFLLKNTVWKEQKKSDFTVETPDKHYLAQVIKVNIINDESCWQMYIWYDVVRMAPSGPLLKNTRLWCNQEKNRQVNEDTFYQISDQYSSKSLRSSRWLSGKEPTCQYRRHRFSPWGGKIPWRRKWQPTLVFLPGESHGHRRLVGYSPWDHRESDTTYRLNSEQGEGGKSEKLSWQRRV